METTPSNYLHPDWEAAGNVHDWRNYVSGEVRSMWEEFTQAQKAALARQAEGLADLEDWD